MTKQMSRFGSQNDFYESLDRMQGMETLRKANLAVKEAAQSVQCKACNGTGCVDDNECCCCDGTGRYGVS